MSNDTEAVTRSIAAAYHQGWTSKRFEDAIALLAPDLVVEVPVNTYPDRASFAKALESFGSMIESVNLLANLVEGKEAMMLYDMVVARLGDIRVAEHLTVESGRITRLRQIHDTVAIRAAGLADDSTV